MSPDALPTPARPVGLRTHWKLHALVLAIHTALFLFMFRDVIRAIPDILAERSFIAAHELIPIFDFQKQFIDQIAGNFSELTNAFEIRVRYAVFTAWMRYYKLIPFALVITSIISSFANYLITLAFAAKVLKRDPDATLARAAFLANLFIFFILLYTKILFYFSMILGYTLFLLSLYFIVHALFYERNHPQRYMVGAALLYVVNPTIHYLVLILFVMLLMAPFCIMRRDGEGWKSSPGIKWLLSMVWLAVAGVLPYALFVKFFVLKGFGSLSDDIPVYYLFIKANSIPLLQFLSFDSGAITDGFLYGRYIPLYPRLTNSFYSLLIFLPLAPSAFRRLFSDRVSKRMGWLMGFLFVVSLWCSLGYNHYSIIPSFYDFLALFMNALYEQGNTAVRLGTKAVEAAIQILRAPHRFQFISLAAGSVLMTGALAHLQEHVLSLDWGAWKKRIVIGILMPALFFVPLLANWDYRTTLTSGDFAQYLAPYPTGNISALRDALDALPTGKTIILPPAGAQQRITDMNGVAHKFLEKIFIYYLNKPSYYYGSDSPLYNKNSFFFILWALQNNQNWWINIMKDLDVRYIVIDKTASADNFSPKIYLSNLDKTLTGTIDGSLTLFRKLFENDGYILYEFTPSANVADARPVYFNGDWATFICSQEKQTGNLDRQKVIVNSNPMDTAQEMDLMTSDIRKAAMDLFAKANPALFARPSSTNFAFNQNVIPSSTYYNIIYPMFNVFWNVKFNYLNMIVPGTFDTLFGAFVGIPKKAPLKFTVTLPSEGTYDLYLRAMPTKNSLTVRVDGRAERAVGLTGKNTTYVKTTTLYARKKQGVNVRNMSPDTLATFIPKEITAIGNQYEYVKIGTETLGPGEHTIYLRKLDESPLVVEGILLVDKTLHPDGLRLPSNVRPLEQTP